MLSKVLNTRIKMINILAVGVALTMLVTTMAVAKALIPDTVGVIHGCYKNNSGTLRVVDSPSQACAGGETALNWNQTGPQGPAGSSSGALAYAYVDSEGVINESLSYNIANYFYNPERQIGCFTVNPTPKNVMVTAQLGSDTEVAGARTVGEGIGAIPEPPYCPEGTNSVVHISTGSDYTRAYYVLFN